jgi:hypothetical protein
MFSTTARSYAKPEAVEGAKQQRAMAVLAIPPSANENAKEHLEGEKLHDSPHNFRLFSPLRPRADWPTNQNS